MMALGAALHRWGIPAHRLEARLNDVARRVGLEAQFYSTPTSLMAGFGPMASQDVRLVRIEPGAVDLSKLLDLDRLSEDVARGGISPTEGLRRVQAIDHRPPLYGSASVILAFSLVAAGAARLFGAGVTEIWAAQGAGLIAGLLSVAIPRTPRAARLFELAAAFCVTAWAAALQAGGVEVSAFLVILAGLIVLVPGLTLTVAVSELATKNLVSGSARLTAAGLTLLQIGFGVGLAQQLAGQWFGPITNPDPVPLPAYTEAVGLVVIAVALTVLFQAPLSLIPGVIAVTGIAVVGTRLGGLLLSPQLSASVGALLVTLMGNAYARWRHRPAIVLIVPGLLVLVPGSLGFRSVNSLLAQNPSLGIELAFDMGMVAVAIVAGLLIANVVLPARVGHDGESPSL